MRDHPEDGAEDGIDEGDVASRSELLPEERAAGSDDPEAQAAGILAESEERILHPEETREESVQTAPPDKRPGIAP